MHYFIALIIMGLCFLSCEEVIEVNLNESDPRLVVEGEVTNQSPPYTVNLSETINFFGGDDYPPVMDAQVTIEDVTSGIKDTLQEKDAGQYMTSNIQGIPDHRYKLTIQRDTQTYEASSYMPPPSPIDSIAIDYQPGNEIIDSGYYLLVTFPNPPQHDKNYLLKLYRNGDELTNEGEFIILNGDDLSPIGRYYFNGYPNSIGDTMRVQLLTMDDVSYEFFNTLNENIEQNSAGSPFAGTPRNPETNISGDAVGHFGTFAVTSKTVIITK